MNGGEDGRTPNKGARQFCSGMVLSYMEGGGHMQGRAV